MSSISEMYMLTHQPVKVCLTAPNLSEERNTQRKKPALIRRHGIVGDHGLCLGLLLNAGEF